MIFAAALHAGIPMNLLKTKKDAGWQAVRESVLDELRGKKDSLVRPLERIDFNTESRFPMGDPVALRYSRFEEKFALDKLFGDSVYRGGSPGAFQTDNTVLICPSGLILIIGRYTASCSKAFNRIGLGIESFSNQIEQNYSELRAIFCDIVKELKPIMDRGMTRSRKEFFRPFCADGDQKKADDNLGDTDPLIDVYYMECKADNNPSGKRRTDDVIKVSYVDMCLSSSDMIYAELILFIYSSFASFKWTVGFLNNKAKEIQNTLAASKSLHSRLDNEIKLLRIFCFELINESRPIMIRLTESYLTPLEMFWKKSRMDDLSYHITQQVENLDRMVEWAEQTRRESTNIRISLAAVILAVISISSAVAGVVSAIDVPQVWDRTLRWLIIVLASGVCIALTLVLAPFIPKIFSALGSMKKDYGQSDGYGLEQKTQKRSSDKRRLTRHNRHERKP